MMLRRVFATAAGLLLLNVSAAEALRVCAAPAHQAVATNAATGHEHHRGQAPKKTDKPAQAECCAAMSSCAVSLEIAGASGVSSAIPDGDRVWAAVDGAPLGLVLSPDPPPPKYEA